MHKVLNYRHKINFKNQFRLNLHPNLQSHRHYFNHDFLNIPILIQFFHF